MFLRLTVSDVCVYVRDIVSIHIRTPVHPSASNTLAQRSFLVPYVQPFNYNYVLFEYFFTAQCVALFTFSTSRLLIFLCILNDILVYTCAVTRAAINVRAGGSCDVLVLSFCPWQPDLFLTGYSDGSIALCHISRGTCMSTHSTTCHKDEITYLIRK